MSTMAAVNRWCLRTAFYSFALSASAGAVFVMFTDLVDDSPMLRWVLAICGMIIPSAAFMVGTCATFIAVVTRARPIGFWSATINCVGFVLIATVLLWGLSHKRTYLSVDGPVEAMFDNAGRLIFTDDPGLAPALADDRVPVTDTWSWYSKQLWHGEGFADHTGQIVIKPQFVGVQPFGAGRAIVEVSRDAGIRQGLIDVDGEFVVPPNADFLLRCRATGGFIICQSRRWQLLKPDGKPKFDFEFEGLRCFSEGLAAARRDGKWGYIDETGGFVIPPSFDAVNSFSGGFAVVNVGGAVTATQSAIGVEIGFRGGRWGLINTEGAFVIPPEFDEVIAVPDQESGTNRYQAKQNNRIEIFDANGAVLESFQIDE